MSKSVSVSFYFDEMMSREPSVQLGNRGITVVMANDVGMTKKDDLTEHLVYATQSGLVLVTMDRPFAGKASQLTEHSGLICITGFRQDDIGGIVRVLTQFAADHTAEDVVGQVFWM